MSQNNIDKDIDNLQEDISVLQENVKQITPLPKGAQVGQTFKVKSINEDGSYIMESVSLFDNSIRRTSIPLLNHKQNATLLRWGRMVWFVQGGDMTQLATGWTYNYGNIPEGYKPCTSMQYFYTVPRQMQYSIHTSGVIDVYNYSTAVSSDANSGVTLCWITYDA